MTDSCWQVTETQGFLITPAPVFDPVPAVAQSIRGAVTEVIDAARRLPELTESGRCRDACLELAIPDFSSAGAVPDERAAERLHQAYAFLSNGYLWQPDAEPTRSLPRTLAIPFVQLSAMVKRPPTLSYANTQLANWQRIDPASPLEVENIKVVQMFQPLADEEWFWTLHIAIEACGAPAVIAGANAVRAARDSDLGTVESQLQTILSGLETIIANARRMEEGCRPEVYFKTLRPFLFAHPDGVVFEGVDEFGGEPQAFLGQTGAQSALIPAICAALGLRHARSELTTYLDAVRAYMPEPHRRFVARLDGRIVRDKIKTAGSQAPARALYNSCVEKVIEFRRLHLGLAANYIASKMDDPVGTGGTDFMRWLGHMTQETTEQLL